MRPAVTVVATLPTADVVAVPATRGSDGAVVDSDGLAFGHAHGVDIAAHLTREKARGEAGEVVAIPVMSGKAPTTVLLVGTGDGSVASLRKAGAAAVRRSRDAASLATTIAAGADMAGVRGFVQSLLLASYAFSLKTNNKQSALKKISVVHAGGSDATAVADKAIRTAAAVRLARDLVNTPSMEKTPAWLADQAVKAAEGTGVEVRVRDERALSAEGFGGILAVGCGSARPPRLIEMSYKPRGRPTGHVVLVGKGITFDSGGLSLKPGEGMVAMKTDMAGGAAVIATMTALRDLGVGVRVTGLVPAAENMPSGTAQRPGDVIRHYGGRTVEVLNTDAEGRLVLADALAYADAKAKPDVMIDIATLTGAASLGLG